MILLDSNPSVLNAVIGFSVICAKFPMFKWGLLRLKVSFAILLNFFYLLSLPEPTRIEPVTSSYQALYPESAGFQTGAVQKFTQQIYSLPSLAA
jgi:hypothetical protein